MRNLKKFLALVLAMMMVMGMMVTVNAAAVPIRPSDDCADSEDITPAYKEAIDVLVAIGAVEGDSKGNLNPQEPFNRAYLATMMYKVAVAKSGDTDPQVIYAKDEEYFTDVTPGKIYPAGYINYAHDYLGVEGRGNGIYDPNAEVTGADVLQGMLNVLGIEREVVTGNWKLDAINTALEEGLVTQAFVKSVDLTGVITREVALQIIFNALNYRNYFETWTVYELNTDGSRKGVAYANIKETLAMSYVTARPDKYEAEQDFSTQLFDVYQVTKNTSASDPYGRPVTAYTNILGTQLVVIPSSTRPLKVDTNEVVSGEDLYAALLGTYVANGTINNIKVWNVIDGEDGNGTYNANTALGRTTVNLATQRLNTAPFGGNGVTVEVYNTANTRTANNNTAIVIAPVYTQIVDVINVRETATHGAYKQYVLKSTSAEALKEFSTTVTRSDVTNVTINGEVSKGDWVIVDTISEYTGNSTLNRITRYEITPVEAIQGTLSKYDANTGVYTIGGNTYPASGIIGSTLIPVDNKSHVFALDADGNVVALMGDSLTGDYIFPLDSRTAYRLADDGTTMESWYRVIGLDPSGKMISLEVERINSTVNPTSTGVANHWIYNYTDTDGNGKYELKSYSNAGDAQGPMLDGTSNFTINGVASALYSGNGKTAIASDATKYYLVEADASSATGFTVTTYTGYKNAGSISGTNIAGLDLDENGVADVVFVWNPSVSAVPTYAYIISDYITTNGKTFTYRAIIDNEVVDDLELSSRITSWPVLVQVSGKTWTPVTSVGGNLMTTWDGESLYVNTNNSDRFYYENGTLMNWYTDKAIAPIRADVPVYLYNEGEMEEITAAELTSSRYGALVIIVATENSGITAMYIVEDAEARISGVLGESVEVESIGAEDGPITVPAGVTLTAETIEEGADITVEEGGKLIAETIEDDATVNVEDGGELECDNIADGATVNVGTNPAAPAAYALVMPLSDPAPAKLTVDVIEGTVNVYSDAIVKAGTIAGEVNANNTADVTADTVTGEVNVSDTAKLTADTIEGTVLVEEGGKLTADTIAKGSDVTIAIYNGVANDIKITTWNEAVHVTGELVANSTTADNRTNLLPMGIYEMYEGQINDDVSKDHHYLVRYNFTTSDVPAASQSGAVIAIKFESSDGELVWDYDNTWKFNAAAGKTGTKFTLNDGVNFEGTPWTGKTVNVTLYWATESGSKGSYTWTPIEDDDGNELPPIFTCSFTYNHEDKWDTFD